MIKNLSCLLMVAVVTIASSAPAHASYVSAVLADNPLVYYRMQETSVATTDPAADSSGNGNTGAYTFATAGSITDAAGMTTEINPGKQFTPGDGFINVPSFGGSTSAFSIEFLIRPDTSTYNPGLTAIFASNGWGGGQVHLNIADGNVELAHPANFPWPVFSLSSFTPQNEWTHVVLTYEVSGANNTIKLFTDGVERASSTTAGSGTADFSIAGRVGSWDGQGRYFPGGLDEFAIYSFALSDTQVAAHFAAIPEPSSLALLAFGMISMFLFRRKR